MKNILIWVYQNKFVILLLLVFLLISGISIRNKSMTYDEKLHSSYAERLLFEGKTERTNALDDSKMPFSVINLMPKMFGNLIEKWNFPNKKIISNLQDISLGRSMTIMMGVFFGIFVFCWSRELYGYKAGLVSLLLYVFSPNIIAHTRLITTDLYATGMILVALYYFWKYHKCNEWHCKIWSAFTLGLAQLAKYTAIFLYPIFLIIVITKAMPSFAELLLKKKFGKMFSEFVSATKTTIFFIVISVLIINTGFLFQNNEITLSRYSFESNLFKSLKTKINSVVDFPLLLPKAYIKGLDMVRHHDWKGTTYRDIYLLGKLQKHSGANGNKFKGFYNYLIISLLFKVPLSVQILFIVSLIYYLINRKKYLFMEDELFIFVPIICFAIYFSFFFRSQLGVRFFMPMLPLVYVFCGSMFKYWDNYSTKLKTSLMLLLVYLIVSVLSYFPHYLSYFNELVLDRKQAYKILADSNIDWGQNEWYLEQYMKSHPKAILRPKKPTSGSIIVAVNELVGIFGYERYQWLRDNFEPAEHIGYSFLVYKVKPEDLKKIKN